MNVWGPREVSAAPALASVPWIGCGLHVGYRLSQLPLWFCGSFRRCTKLIVAFFSSARLSSGLILHLEGGVSAVPAPASTSIVLYEYRGLQVVQLRIMGVL